MNTLGSMEKRGGGAGIGTVAIFSPVSAGGAVAEKAQDYADRMESGEGAFADLDAVDIALSIQDGCGNYRVTMCALEVLLDNWCMDLIGPVKCRGRFGYVTPKGDYAIAPVFEELGACSEGLISFREGDRIGFLNMDGSIRIPLGLENFEEAMPTFRSGLAAVRSGGVFGYIDIDGHWQIPASFVFARDFLEDKALVEAVGKYFVIDKNGARLTMLDVWDIRRLEDWIKDWNCFRCLFSTKQGLSDFFEGCLNWRGEIVFPPIHDRITDFFNGVAGFSDGDETLGSLWGLVNFEGGILKEPQYLQMDCFSEGLASAAQSLSPTGWVDNFGYIDIAGEWVIPPRFQQVFRFSSGLARVAVGGRCNRFGEIIGERRFGFINHDGALVVEPRFSSAMDFVGDHAVVGLDGKSAIIDKAGAIIWAEE